MAGRATASLVDLGTGVGLRFLRSREGADDEGPGRGQEVGQGYRGAAAAVGREACEQVGHRRARVHGVRIGEVSGKPRGVEPAAHGVEHRRLLWREVRERRPCRSVAVYAPEFSEQQQPRLDAAVVIGGLPAEPLVPGHERRGMRATGRQPEKCHPNEDAAIHALSSEEP